MAGCISLITDFNAHDAYVGMMKGAMLSVNDTVSIVDVCHAIPPQDIVAAAFQLGVSYSYFPEGTIHVVVVDPSVGTVRPIIAVKTYRYIFLAPDNGVLTWIFRDTTIQGIRRVENKSLYCPEVSATFHGRDIFAPVAAELSKGFLFDDLGPVHENPVHVLLPEAEETADGVRGEVISIDGFGNLITNIPADMCSEQSRIALGEIVISGVSHVYGGHAEGDFLALVGGHGFLEVAVCNGSAAALSGVGKGFIVSVTG